MSTNKITEAIEPDIAKALGVIANIAEKAARGRASSIVELSGGAVTTTPEQVETIAASIRAQMIGELREQVRSTVVAYTTTTQVFKA